MQPKAKLLPLTDEQLKTLGELVALHGFIAQELFKSVTWLNVAHGNNGDMGKIIQHKSMSDDVEEWARFAERSPKHSVFLPKVQSLKARLLQNIKDRNDYVHAVYEEELETGGYLGGPYNMGSFGEAVAVRQGKKQPAKRLDTLSSVRDEAEAIANELVDLDYEIIRPHLSPLFKQ